MTELVVKNLYVSTEEKRILRGVGLGINPGEIHALMGPNGSGKTTLSQAIMGNPAFKVTRGKILFRGEDIVAWSPEKRAQRGIFLAFQYPVEVGGVGFFNFLRIAYNTLHPDRALNVRAFRDLVRGKIELLGMDRSFVTRNLNEGFSGGEKKRAEILQLAVLEPKLAILDETDSGLDIDSLRVVSEGLQLIRKKRQKNKEEPLTILLVTHYPRILSLLPPDKVHILVEGRIVDSGGPSLAVKLEKKGYAAYSS